LQQKSSKRACGAFDRNTKIRYSYGLRKFSAEFGLIAVVKLGVSGFFPGLVVSQDARKPMGR
jgi:hypothetical protein